jgi:hypothetical protein
VIDVIPLAWRWKSGVCEIGAMGETHLAHVAGVCPYIANRDVGDEGAVIEIDLQKQRA